MPTWLPIVGESHYQAELRAALAAHPDRVVPAALEREPANPFDSNAIALKGDDGQTFGYLSREMAQEFDAALDAMGGRLAVHAELRGGEDGKPAIGIVFDGAALIDGKHQASRAHREHPHANVSPEEIRDIVTRGFGAPTATLAKLTLQEMPEFNLRGKGLEDQGRVVDALTVYEEAIARGADTPFTFERLGVLYRRYKCVEAAERVRALALKRLGFDASAPAGQRRGVDTSRSATGTTLSRDEEAAVERLKQAVAPFAAVAPKPSNAPTVWPAGRPSARAWIQASVIFAIIAAGIAFLVYSQR